MGKRIVICADGTGNRGGVTRGTNVYRIANAIDIWGHVGTDRTRQVMFYQDGVGTDSAKILKIAGGAFGYGLSANVRQLYSFLVRNYEDGDDIYLFGFSRGAYTVRTFARLVTACGLIDKRHYRSGRELDKLVRQAYKAHRKTQRADIPEWNTKALARKAEREQREGKKPTPADVFKETWGREVPSNAARYADRGYGPNDVPIKLVGVWDTVGAVGLPFEELTDALDVYVGLKIKNTELHPLVEIGLQALAIDEERQTFYPVLWNERAKKEKNRTWQKIEQVWFPGVHSNVGGGYPKDQLAHVSLHWMMERAEEMTGLRFLEAKKSEYADAANPNGRIYDSRSGLKIYYRFRPRNVPALSRDKLADGDQPRVHAAVLERIRRGTSDYAPTALGVHEVVGDKGSETRGSDPDRDKKSRDCLQRARDLIWWRRLLYYTFLGTTLALVLRLVSLGKADVDCEVAWPFLGWVFGLAERMAPGFATGPIEALRNHPYYLLLYLVIAIVLLVLRRNVTRATANLSLAGWKCVLGEDWEMPRRSLWQKIGRWFRTSRRLESAVLFFKRSFLPRVLAFGVPLLVLWGLSVYVRGAWNTVGGAPSAENCCPVIEPLGPGGVAVIEDFDTRRPCFETGIQLLEGHRYAFDVEVDPATPWKDASHAAGPEGLTGAPSRVMKLFSPFLRAKKEDYLTLMGGISCDDGQTFRIGEGVSGIEAEATGPLYLFANDTTCYVCPGGAWSLYENNQGKARLRVRNLAPAGAN